MPLSSIALTMLHPQVSPLQLMQLYNAVGNCDDIVNNYKDLSDIIPEISDRFQGIMQSMPDALRRAEQEIAFCEKHSIEILTYDNPHFPQRLKECDDAPLVLYYRGNTDLNCQRIINIIGTRHCTSYGQDLIRKLVADLHAMYPDILIVSGLAYGVDIHAHRNALQQGMQTVGVLAHGLDMIYPATHRETAKDMTRQGGLLTEYPSGTRPEKRNFVQRNRIVAGMSDACVLVESASRGGGLITASISSNYNREVFAFPGNIGAPYSEGCNNLIRDKGAHLVTSASDILDFLHWSDSKTLENARSKGIERELFPDLTNDEQTVVNALQKHGDQQINMLAINTQMPISSITATLFTLEMKGVVRPMAGGCYHLLG